MQTGVSATDAVVLIRVDEEIERLVGFHQGCYKIHGILHVYVVVGGAVYQQEATLKVFRIIDR